MQEQQHFLNSADNHRIFLREWQPKDGKLRGIVHINHGMAEHSGRYHELAQILTKAGFMVFAHDHRGHGQSIPKGGLVGHYHDSDGWQLVLRDAKAVNEYFRKEHPNLPVVMLGHSMGSFITQAYAVEHGNTLDAVVLSGSGFTPKIGLRAPKMLVRLEKYRTGAKARSPLIDRQTFASFNKKVGKTRTEADWLTRDREQVDRYIKDPLCGFMCTNQLWDDFLQGLETISQQKNIHRIPSHLPFYLISGERDPLSYHTKKHGVARLAEHLNSGGLKDVTLRLYENCRHEIFNEINRNEVYQSLLDWMESKIEHISQTKKVETAYA